MGNIYWYAGDYATAEVCQTQKLQITLELGDRIETSRSASMIGLIYLDQGALNDAERFIDRAIALARALDAPSDLADFLFNKANLLNAQENPEEALAVLQETIRLAASVDNTTTQFEAQITSIRTQVQLERIDTHTAIQRLEALLETSHDDHDHDDHDGHPEEEHHEHDNDEQVASISYEIWKLDPAREAGRQRAADLYRQLYQNTPSHEFRSCYAELTGARRPGRPDPPPLPPLPEIVTQKPVNPDTLLIQIDALIQEAKADTHQHHNHH
ncbi:MAG: tetratricopeptide repeat protein [Anaerolineales bacterium]